MIKALFFDIDGTLVSFESHKIPASTVQAIKQAKALGVKVFISTGRPRAFINGLEDIENFIDGYITNNGAYINHGDKEIHSNPISRADTQILMNYAKEFSFPTIVMGKHDFGIYNYKEIVKTVFYGGLRIRIDLNRKDVEEVLKDDVFQITMFLSPKEEEMLMNKVTHCNSGRWCDDFTDITDKNADKGKALIKMAEYFNIDLSQTMSFGDGGNDIPIIKTAGIGVAMGNANENVKAVSDFVTTTVDNDGIFNALKHFGVI
ncbi:MAG: Cof-type HAD-IIB family hydrolase [Bacteroidales bacterium]|nr:Cof-type HAD-IIB family hydrolase [Bacteroidales bacterium]